jgi:hypothetical protein
MLPTAATVRKRRRVGSTGSADVFDAFMASVEHWAMKQTDQPGRSEAIRRLVELGLKAKR